MKNIILSFLALFLVGCALTPKARFDRVILVGASTVKSSADALVSWDQATKEKLEKDETLTNDQKLEKFQKYKVQRDKASTGILAASRLIDELQLVSGIWDATRSKPSNYDSLIEKIVKAITNLTLTIRELVL